MKCQRSKPTRKHLSTALKRETVLANWMEAIVTFEQYYNDLDCYVSTDHQSGHPGQCPMGGLIPMLVRMQEELEDLVLDLDNADQTILQKIVDHTVTLTQLNHRAQTLLHLARLPAS